MGKSALAAAAPAATDEEVRSHERAFRSAVALKGSVEALAAALGLKTAVVNQWLDSDGECPLPYCALIEEATGVKCDDLRSDVIWLRTDTDVIGYVMPVAGADVGFVQAHLKVQQGTRDRSFITGLFNDLPEEEADDIIARFDLDTRGANWNLDELGQARDVAFSRQLECFQAWYPLTFNRVMFEGVIYGLSADRCQELRDINLKQFEGRPIDLDDLLNDIYIDKQDAAYFEACGVTHGIPDAQRTELAKRYPSLNGDVRVAAPGELNRLQGECDRLRGLVPVTSVGKLDPNAPALTQQYLMGMAYGIQDGPDMDALMRKHGVTEESVANWTPAKSEALHADVRRILTEDEAGANGPDYGTPGIDDLMTWYSPYSGPYFAKDRLDRKRQAAHNVQQVLMSGLIAISDYQFTEQMVDDKVGPKVDDGSRSDITLLSGLVAKMLKRTTELHDQFDFALRPPANAGVCIKAVTE